MKKYIVKSGRSNLINKLVPGLFVLSLFFFSCNRYQADTGKTEWFIATGLSGHEKSVSIESPDDGILLTIHAIYDDPESRNAEIRFYERAGIYSIDKENKTYIENRALLTEAIRANFPVKFFIQEKGGLVLSIVKATEEEIRLYNTGDGINSPNRRVPNAAVPVKIDVNKIDTSSFNRVISQINYFPVLKLCDNVVPNYATLVNIFNDCAKEGCNKPPPYSITNCIPFQYVHDGCYARAHKMRQIIQKKYKYCVEKVFSFAEGYPNTLAVKANMWGGCCVSWWYHVVPLLRINVQIGRGVYQVCYVIDPGMFTQPVTLSTWLQAQKNTSCSPNANVTSYSIQSGSAYWPLGSSASFGTDPNYIQTEQTLINYKNLITCN